MRGRTGQSKPPQLAETQSRLTRWRRQHGGPGRPLPEHLWAEAVEVARVEGIAATARALRVDRARLTTRMADEDPEDAATGGGAGVGEQFVELDAARVCLPSEHKTVVRFDSGDGKRLELELGGGPPLDVVALAEAFWRQR